MNDFKFNLTPKQKQEHEKCFNSFMDAITAGKKSKSVAVAELQGLFTTAISSSFEQLNCYLPCNDGSGQVYNAKTGERFGLKPVGKKMIGQFS